jgi:hypothetical protein
MLNSRMMSWEVQMSSMEEFHTEFWWKNLKEDLEDLGAGRIILKCIFKKQDGRM